MSNDAVGIAELQRDVAYLMDRAKIIDCVARHARAQDRHDSALLKTAYHTDGYDEHGNVVNKAADYPAWVNALHDESFGLHLHCITTHNCEITAGVAHAESYVLFGLETRDGAEVWFGGGRYVDRLEERDGEWRIAVRRTIIDWMFKADAAPMHSSYFLQQGYPTGKKDRTDISYQRPLQINQINKV
jgi:hypothetical protein